MITPSADTFCSIMNELIRDAALIVSESSCLRHMRYIPINAALTSHFNAMIARRMIIECKATTMMPKEREKRREREKEREIEAGRVTGRGGGR